MYTSIIIGEQSNYCVQAIYHFIDTLWRLRIISTDDILCWNVAQCEKYVVRILGEAINE